jgi:serpin B
MRKILALIAVICVLVGITTYLLIKQNNMEKTIAKLEQQVQTNNSQPSEKPDEEKPEIENTQEPEAATESPAPKASPVENSELSDFDLSFLKMEQDGKNLVYSPVSIKFALKMLEEGTEGESKTQISNVIGKYNPTIYKNSKNLSLANGLWIRDNFKDDIKQSYMDNLRAKYSADVHFDSFKDASMINGWIKNSTLGIIPQMLTDSDVSDLQFALVNALAIDMEWIEKFTQDRGVGTYASTKFEHEDEDINVYDVPFLQKASFNKTGNEYSVMKIKKVVNNYDIINEIGEEEIKKIVTDDYKKWLKLIPGTAKGGGDIPLGAEEPENYTIEMAEKDMAEFLPTYIEEISKNYHKEGDTTDFGAYWDDDVKVFQKSLKTYDGTTLEYIGIMPIKKDVDEYVKNVSAKELLEIFSKIKYKAEDYEEGVVTRITGTIPKFTFEYNLSLKEDLIKQGISDVFEEGKANLTNLTDTEGIYIDDAKHKANIEFTQDGIKAAAATFVGGAGGGSSYDYLFDVPIKEVDLTFDKPYLFFVKDKNNGDVWFVGTVYEPLLWENDSTVGNSAYDF